jgi:hypothetical protein
VPAEVRRHADRRDGAGVAAGAGAVRRQWPKSAGPRH